MAIQSILIAGGYGLVGREVAGLIRHHHPDIRILLGGRNPGTAEALAQQLGNSATVRLDTADADPLAGLAETPDLVVAVVNDTDDRLLLSCVRQGIAYIDVTRWTERMRDSIQRLNDQQHLRAPVVFSSSWMAGVVATVAAGFAQQFAAVDQIDIGILYANEDRAGPNSVEYMDRMHLAFEVYEGGERSIVKPFRRAHRTEFPGTGSFNLYRFDSPDQFTLPSITQAGGVAARIGFDDHLSGPLLSTLVKTGIWRMIAGRAFTGLRRGLLYSPGEGAPHRVRVDIRGALTDGTQQTRSWLITDPESQTHMTATGALIQIDRLIKSDGLAEAGVQIAEAVTSLDHCLGLLEANNIEVSALN